MTEYDIMNLNLSNSEDVKRLEEWYNMLVNKVLKSHPKYPEYGYAFIDGYLTEIKLPQ